MSAPVLSTLLAADGEVVEAHSNPPVSLADPLAVWIVEEGEADVFAGESRPDGMVVARGLIGTVHTGDLLLGGTLVVDGESLALSAVGVPSARLRRVELAALRRHAADPEVADELPAAVDHWLIMFAACLGRRVPPGKVVLLEPGATLGLEPGSRGLTRHAAVWVRPEDGACTLLGSPHAELPLRSQWLPVTKDLWIEPRGKSRLRCADTASCLAEDAGWEGLRTFQRVALHLWLEKSREEHAAEQLRLQSKAEADTRVIEQAIRGLTDVMQPAARRRDRGASDPLQAAFRLAAAVLEVPVTLPSGRAGQVSLNPLQDLAVASRLRLRQVALRGEWWTHAVGPMIGFLAENHHPIALLPHGAGYDVVDPSAGTRARVGQATAAELPLFAYTFYRPLPDRALNAFDLLHAGLRVCRQEAGWLAVFGVAGSILGTVGPLATAKLINETIPGVDRAELWQIGVALLAANFATTVFNFSSTVAILRMEAKMEATVQSGLWDRLLNLPVPFFRLYSSGDLADRAMGINHIRKMLTDTAISTLLSAIFSVFSLGLLFVYSPPLALAACGLVATASLATTVVSYVQLRYQRRLYALSGKLGGLVFQILTGISKLRVAKAESRAFAVWSRRFSEQKSLTLRARQATNLLQTFYAAFGLLSTLTVFVGFVALNTTGLPAGSFLAFNAAFGTFMAAGLSFAGSFISLLQIIPLYERARPILQTLPEVSQANADPGSLNGEIVLTGISFRYKTDGAPILRDVSFRIPPTEFVALVGPSGSGKSTLFRLMLGFEKPESGTVSYDGQDLNTLNVQAVRRQIGVVLQQGRLLSGDIYHNIIGALPLTMEDAWEAARKAGFAEDVEAMPMGMFTFLSEGGGNLSGGQRQRLLIARALAAKPKILFFDEATSALDNRTQAIVSRSLEAMRVTRVVIAHRLSTIRHADRIVVVDAGRVAEMGTYEELMALNGTFAKLARRQLV